MIEQNRKDLALRMSRRPRPRPLRCRKTGGPEPHYAPEPPAQYAQRSNTPRLRGIMKRSMPSLRAKTKRRSMRNSRATTSRRVLSRPRASRGQLPTTA